MSKILILGGGFAGLMAALNAAEQRDNVVGDLDITMVSPSRFLTIRPRLYQRDPETLRVPLAPSLEPVGVAFIEAAARSLDVAAQEVRLEARDGTSTVASYDRLILATGSEMRPLAVPGAAEHAFDIDSYQGAVTLDRHLQKLAEAPDAPGHNTFVIVGGGMSGIELAAEMRSRVAVHAGPSASASARVILIDRAPALGEGFAADARGPIARALAEAGVDVRLSTTIGKVEGNAVTLDSGERIEAATTVVTVGMHANSLTERIQAERDAAGRLFVDDMLRVKGVDGVYAAGDVAHAVAGEEQVALMSCQHSRIMGKYAGYNAARELMGLELHPYRQPNYTTTLDLGAFGAICTTGWDRQLDHYGAEAKKRKNFINSQLIYPPTGDREAIFANGRIDPASGR